MPQVVRYFEKSPENPGAYVETIREYMPDGTSVAQRGKLYRVASDSETGGEVAFVPDLSAPVRLVLR